MWYMGSYYKIPKAKFYLLKGDYSPKTITPSAGPPLCRHEAGRAQVPEAKVEEMSAMDLMSFIGSPSQPPIQVGATPGRGLEV